MIEAITSLYKLSMTIRNPTPRDRYAKAASLNTFDTSYDVGHVYEKFPHVRSKLWLMDRLGRAITRRREFLRYRETHREKLGDYFKPPTDPYDAGRKITYNEVQIPTRGPKSGLGAHSVIHSQLASTKATSYVANLNGENIDTGSTAGCSDVSYVTSIAEDISDNMRQVPDPPNKSANGKPFECPYCFTILEIKNTKQWK